MNQEVAELWWQALCCYLYPITGDRVVGFGKLIHIAAPWFTFDLRGGSRTETIKFEDRFWASGHEAREAWFEVIFWKLASTGRLGESRARRMIEDLIAIGCGCAGTLARLRGLCRQLEPKIVRGVCKRRSSS
jgi:hypothetical protein